MLSADFWKIKAEPDVLVPPLDLMPDQELRRAASHAAYIDPKAHVAVLDRRR